MAIVLLMANNHSNAVVESATLKEAFEASDKKYRSLVDNSIVGIFIVQNSVIRFCNQQFAAIFGYALAGDVSGMPIESLLPPDGGAMCLTEQAVKGILRCERKARQIAGGMLDLKLLLAPIRFEGGAAVQGSVIDITDRKNAEKEIRRSFDHPISSASGRIQRINRVRRRHRHS